MKYFFMGLPRSFRNDIIELPLNYRVNTTVTFLASSEEIKIAHEF